jgi:hypothetical protein
MHTFQGFLKTASVPLFLLAISSLLAPSPARADETSAIQWLAKQEKELNLKMSGPLSLIDYFRTRDQALKSPSKGPGAHQTEMDYYSGAIKEQLTLLEPFESKLKLIRKLSGKPALSTEDIEGELDQSTSEETREFLRDAMTTLLAPNPAFGQAGMATDTRARSAAAPLSHAAELR